MFDLILFLIVLALIGFAAFYIFKKNRKPGNGQSGPGGSNGRPGADKH